MENKELTIEQEIVKDCPILFQMIDRPCTETTMCWGFECGKGWHYEIGKTCRLFETLNNEFYSKYRVRIQADQIKEKYGTLRFYYSVIHDPGKIKTFVAKIFRSIENLCNKINYKTKKVVDVEPYDYDDVKEITKKEYDKYTKKNSKNVFRPSNVNYKKDGKKYLRITTIHNYGQSHVEPTRFKMFWKLRLFARKMYNNFMYCNIKTTSQVRNCMSVLDNITRNEINKLEKHCEDICEMCGTQIGTKFSPKCETSGYIQYLCKDCFKKINSKETK